MMGIDGNRPDGKKDMKSTATTAAIKTATPARLPANDVAPKTSHGDLVRIRQEIAAEAFAKTPRGKRLLAARR